jgi:hypothetical protein
MIARVLKAIILYPIGARQVSIAARHMSQARIRREREFVRSVARQIRAETGLPPDNRLRG